MGQAAGLAAAQSLRTGQLLRALHVGKLQKRLHQLLAATVYTSDVLPGNPHYELVQRIGAAGYLHDIYDPRVVTAKPSAPVAGTQWRGPPPDLHDAKLDFPVGVELLAKGSSRAKQSIPFPASATRLQVFQWLDSHPPAVVAR